MCARGPQNKAVHDQTVADIAKLRFPYPDSAHPDWKTYLNEPNKTMGIKKNSETIYPDIVVVDVSKNQVALVGEIETSDTIDQEGAAQWNKYSKSCDSVYLYVPNGCADDARELLRANNIPLAGLRTYGYDQSGNITITNA